MLRKLRWMMVAFILLVMVTGAWAQPTAHPALAAPVPTAAESAAMEPGESPPAGDKETAAPASPAPVPKPTVLTQREFAIKLIQDLNLGSLPKKPKDRHLQTLLGGRRSYVFEAEDYFNKQQDKVVLRNYNTIGAFSGKGWLSAPPEPTSVSFRARLPLSGIYHMKVRGAGKGQLWSIGGRAIKVDCGPQLSEADAGMVILDAELMNFTVVLPPEGAVDVITLTAPDLPAIQPQGGWQFDQPLTYGIAAEVAASLIRDALKLSNNPAIPPRKVPVAGNAALPSGVSLVNDMIFGRFFGEGWFRNGYQPSAVELPFQVEATAMYGVKAHWFGKQFTGTIDGVALSGRGKGYFDWTDLGSFFLEKGKHLLRVELAPSEGIDGIELTAKVSGADAYLKALAWSQTAAQFVPPADFDRLMQDIAGRYLSATKK